VRHYVTAPRARELPVLLASMRRHCKPFRLQVFALDFEPEPQPDVKVTTRAQLETRHPEYRHLPGPPREPVNLIDTFRWRFMADLLADGVGPLCYTDGDVWFFSSPEPVFAEIGGAGLAVSPHRIPPRALGLPGVCLETHRAYGLYNSGAVFVADPAVAEDMAARVFEWSYCDVVPRPGRRPLFGDQAHLEDVAERHGAHVIQHPGFNVAPWNVARYSLAPGNPPTVDGQPIVTYHFSSLRLNPDGTVAQLASAPYEVEKAAGARELIYEPYLRTSTSRARSRRNFEPRRLEPGHHPQGHGPTARSG
jgi:hypothetical protein